MKKGLLIFFLVLSAYSFAADTLIFRRHFPIIKTVIVQDTLMDIAGSSLDTFKTRPVIVFIIRDYLGRIMYGNTHEVTVYDEKLSQNRKLLFVKGVAAFTDLTEFNVNNAVETLYSFKIQYSFGFAVNSIIFKTPFKGTVPVGKALVYEVNLGIPAHYAECNISLPKGIKAKRKQEIFSFMSSKPYDYFASESRNPIATQDIRNLLGLPEKKLKKIFCNCTFYEGSK